MPSSLRHGLKCACLLLSLLLQQEAIFGQDAFLTSNETKILWQPNTVLSKDDYQGTLTLHLDSLMKKYGMEASACIGIWSVLDVPKKKKDRYRKFEKFYFAPAFDRMGSTRISDDSSQLAIENLSFDMAEYWSRWARRELQTFQDSTQATGTLTIWYQTVVDQMQHNKSSMYLGYIKDVCIDKKSGAFEDWKRLVSDLLKSTEAWTTTPEECHRLLTKTPVEPGYILAPHVMGSMFKPEE